MDFNNLMNKRAEEKAGSSDLPKGAEEAYKTFNSTEGTYQEKASAAFSEYQKNKGEGNIEEKTGGKDETDTLG